MKSRLMRIQGLANRAVAFRTWAVSLSLALLVACGGSDGGSDNGNNQTVDTTPPAAVNNFTASALDQRISLNWSNPADSDFAGVMIRRSTSTNPASVNDGIQVYSGSGSSTIDTGLSNGTTYYYSIFAYDEVPNYSSAVSRSATPADFLIDAGTDQTIVLADTANLDAVATENGQPPQGTVTYSWSQLSGPGIANFTNANAAQTAVAFTAIGSYELQITANTASKSATDSLMVTVNLKAAGSPGLLSRPVNADCVAPATPPVASSIQLVNPYPNLPALTTPLAMYMAPGDPGFWYVVQQTGQVIKFANDPNVNTTSTFIDISDRVEYYGEMGLLGMAFHPDYANNGYVYLSYNNTDSGRDSRISRFTRVGNVLDPSSEVIILSLTQPSTNHNGGQIMFGPDGYLYIGLGDGGGSYDTYGNGQNTDTLLGALLRIDVADGSSGSYTIPPSNPFVAGGGAPEIFAYGLRNPWRWSFDRQTGEIWAGDVGQGDYEEIDIITNGANYGWPIMEGPNCVTAGCDQTGLTLPVGGYERSLGQSITGGYVYRGSSIGFLYGQYIYGDFSIGRIWALQKTGPSQYTSTELLDTSLNIASFAEDHDGELYVINLFGGISKIVADSSSSQTGTIPIQLSGWGCFQSSDIRLFSDNVIPYNINALLWSDFANKERFMAIPDGTTINIDDQGRFDLPVGSVVGKHFWLDGQLIETRLLLHHDAPHGWKGYSYEWDDTQTDATLLTSSKDKDFDVNGQTQTWHYPSQAQCESCHTTVAGFTLGPEIGQLNRSLVYPTTSIEANQLITLEDINVLSRALSDAEKSTTFYAIDDIAYSPERRARSYLHSNCANCHQPGGPGGGNMDLRMATALADTGICNHAPLGDTLGLSNPMIVAPGDPDNSVLVLRMADLGANRMPPLATTIVDTQAISVIRDWISNLSSCQ